MATERVTDTTALHSAHNYKVVTTLASELDLRDTSTGISGDTRAIRCQAAGTLRVRKQNGDTEDVPFLAGERQDIVAKALVTVVSGTCLPVTVYGA